MQWWISNKYALYERMNDTGESEGLPHLRFKVFHFPGHGNQHTLVK